MGGTSISKTEGTTDTEIVSIITMKQKQNKIRVIRVSKQSINSQYQQGQVIINTEYQQSLSKRTVHNKHRESFNDDNEAETNKIRVLRVSTQSTNSQYQQGQVTINTECQ